MTAVVAGSVSFGSDREAARTPDEALRRWTAAVDAAGTRAAALAARGEFAAAGPLADGGAFMAVDRFASHPLYVCADGGVRWACRADELAARDSPALDPQALFDYLYFHVIPAPRTVFRGVQKLPAAHCATYRGRTLSVERYWPARFGNPGSASFAQLRERFRSLLRQAVERQTAGAERVACFLSGGTDSSTIVGVVCEVLGRPVATYSIGFKAEGYDEMAYARIAARHFGAEHHEYYVTPEDLIEHIPKVAAAYDQPFGNSSALPAYVCALEAKADGVTKMLAGDGGDELFGGNSRYATQRLFGYYDKVPALVRRGLLEPFFSMPWVARMPGLKKGSSYIRQARMNTPDRLQEFNLLRRLGYAEVLTPALLAQVDTDSPRRQQQAVWGEADSAHEIDRHLAYDWRYTLADCDLPKVRGTTALAGLDVGFPMLDSDLLEFSMQLAPRDKLNGAQLRWFFKEALRGWLPDEILAKKKQGFGLPFGVWTMRHAGLKAMAADAMSGVAERGIVRPEFVRSLMDLRMPEAPAYYGTMVWILMMLEYWLRAHAPAYRLR